MKRATLLAVLLLQLAGCATLGFGSDESEERAAMWDAAQDALAIANFARAEATFEEIVARYPDTLEGRESLFYLGSIRLDPRNPEWDSKPAAARLAQYLGFMTEDGPRLYRYPEAQTLFELARQLNLPGDSRVAGLQPEERVVTVQDRVVVPGTESRELASQVERLRAEIAAKDARIQEQEVELERIRRTLTGTPPR